MENNTIINHSLPIINSLMSGESWLSYSSLKAFKKSPIDFINYKLGKKETTDAMLFGSMLHCLVLEPNDFDSRYHCLDDTDICNQIGGAKPRATNKYKEWKETALADAGDKVLVETNDYISAKIIASNVLHNRASRKILDICWEHEKGIEWEFKNFKFKGFIDGLGIGAICDLKTCQDADPEFFQRDIIKNCYHIQAAMYLYAEGKMQDYYIIAVDRKGGVSVHKLRMELIEQGMKDYNELLDKFNFCILRDAFDQSYDFHSKRFDGIFDMEKPKWMY